MLIFDGKKNALFVQIRYVTSGESDISDYKLSEELPLEKEVNDYRK